MNQDKISKMRAAGKILGELLRDLREYVVVGRNALEVDEWVRKEVVKRGAEVAYDEIKNPKFPGAICISVNEELVHGVPKDYEFLEGDKVSFDMVIKYQGYYADAAITMVVGEGSTAVKRLIKITEEALMAGIAVVKAGVKIGDISAEVERVLRKGHLGVVENYVGHGIGEKMHMAPEVPNYGKRGTGPVLKAGDTICIEPMSSLGKAKNRVADDGWTVVLSDGSIACHVEHTVLVLEDGYEILTKV